MPKEVTINYSYVKAEYLVRFFEDGKLVKWEVIGRAAEVGEAISKFYHPN